MTSRDSAKSSTHRAFIACLMRLESLHDWESDCAAKSRQHAVPDLTFSVTSCKCLLDYFLPQDVASLGVVRPGSCSNIYNRRLSDAQGIFHIEGPDWAATRKRVQADTVVAKEYKFLLQQELHAASSCQ